MTISNFRMDSMHTAHSMKLVLEILKLLLN